MKARLLAAALREPLVHFAAGGLVIFAIHARFAPSPRDDRIVVSAAFVEGLVREHTTRTGRAPTPDEERALVERFVDEEILYREAVSLGLDRGDPIVRRRMAQKMGFLAEDDAARREPTDAELEAFLDAHAARYRGGPRVSFRHVFFGRDHRADVVADATAALAALRSGASPETMGDPFLRGSSFSGRTPAEVEAIFGGALARGVDTAPRGSWQGPFGSSYGAHLVLVEDRVEDALPKLASVRSRVRQDLLDERRADAQRDLMRRLRARYRVERR